MSGKERGVVDFLEWWEDFRRRNGLDRPLPLPPEDAPPPPRPRTETERDEETE